MKVFTIENELLKAVFLDYGATLHQLWVKDKKGVPTNVIMGLETPKEYLEDSWSRGAVVGRFAGRLENPIHVQSKPIPIEHSDGVLLHSGSSGWNTKTWNLKEEKKDMISFSHFCPEGASGFPGYVEAEIMYHLKENSLHLNYLAQTSADTHINLTNHAYFNLNPKGKINTQYLCIHADEVLELKSTLVPNGIKKSVKETQFDFKEQKQINNTRLDDYFVLQNDSKEAAVLFSQETGIEMKTVTNQPGLVVFTPPHFEAICFETQKFSNTPNISKFPSTLIKAGELYNQKTHYTFSLKTV